MVKGKIVILLISIGAIFGFLLAKNLASESIPKGYVRITVDNQSGSEVDTLTLRYSSGYVFQTNIKSKESVNLYFKNGGENSYWLKAILSDGKVIKSKGEYVEAGYRNTEILTNSEFKIVRDK